MDATPSPSPGDATTDPAADLALPSTRRLRAEVLIVLGLTLGASAIRSALRLIERYLAERPVGEQSTTLNPSYSDTTWLDQVWQVYTIVFQLVPVALVIYLLSANGVRALPRLGLTRTNADGSPRAWWRDVVMGMGLAAVIGIPGLALYAAGRALDQTVTIKTSGLPDEWWSALYLLAHAGVAALVEEFIVVGYFVTRLRDLRWGVAGAIVASALVRGGYHLYQGWPMALGNVVMGVVFALVFVRTGRLGPLIVAHWLLDAASFIGPEFLPAEWIDALNGG